MKLCLGHGVVAGGLLIPRREAQAEEQGNLSRPSGRPERWLIGPNQRKLGRIGSPHR